MPTEIQEALNSLGASALIPKVISPQLLEYVRRYSPLMAAIPSKKWDTNVYYFNTRTALPSGGFVAEGSARPVTNSTYVQGGFNIRLLQAVGQVTGFAQEVTRAQIGDLLRKEVQGTTKSLTWSIETGLCWGNQSSTYGTWQEFDGLDVQCSNFTAGSATQNSLDAAGAEITLGWLDQLIDIVESNAAEAVDGNDYMFVMSPRAISSYSQALIPQQRYEKVEVAPGIIVPSYRGIPLVKSSFLGAKGVAMGAVTTSPTNSGGTLAAGTYYYRVSAIMDRYGELNACAEVSQAVTGGASIIALSFSTPASIEGASVLTYRVYRSTATGAESLLGVVDAVVGFQADGITPIYTTTITDTGTALVPSNGATQPAVAPTQYFNTNSGILPRTTASSGNGGGEDLYLIPKNEDYILRPYVREIRPVPVAATITAPDVLPFAMVTDTCLAIRAAKYMSRLRNLVATLSTSNPTLLMHSV